jgi:glycosyltransferase involved in cell wall biosynthesis
VERPFVGVEMNLNGSKPSVLHVGKFFPPHMGGMETHLHDLCQGLVESYDVRVLVASGTRSALNEEINGIHVSRLRTPLTLFSTPLCPSMASQIREANADVVHIHLPNPAAVSAYLASGCRGRLIFTYHSDTVRQRMLGMLVEPMLHVAMRRSSAVIATSPNYVRTSPVLSRYHDRCHVIPLGIAVEDFTHSDPEQVAAVRRQYGDRLIVSVGRLVYYKGFEYLIRAMPGVRGTLLIIGEGPLRGKLSKLASELGIADRVHFLGKVDQELLVACYHAASVFVLASVARSEAFGIVQIEAMAAGLPVVNTGLDSGVPYVSPHNQTGLTVPPADSAALATAITTLLDDDALRQKFGLAGQLRAHQEFSLQSMASATRKLYDRVRELPPGTPVSGLNTGYARFESPSPQPSASEVVGR